MSKDSAGVWNSNPCLKIKLAFLAVLDVLVETFHARNFDCCKKGCPSVLIQGIGIVLFRNGLYGSKRSFCKSVALLRCPKESFQLANYLL